MTRIPDDELILDWWEAYDGGMSTRSIASKWRWPRATVLRALGRQGLDVLSRTADVEPGDVDEALVEDAVRGILPPSDEQAMEALSRCALILHPRHLGYARSLPHAMPQTGRHTVHKMSAKERMQDRMATGIERHHARMELAAMGLMPPRSTRAKRVGRYWS